MARAKASQPPRERSPSWACALCRPSGRPLLSLGHRGALQRCSSAARTSASRPRARAQLCVQTGRCPSRVRSCAMLPQLRVLFFPQGLCRMRMLPKRSARNQHSRPSGTRLHTRLPRWQGVRNYSQAEWTAAQPVLVFWAVSSCAVQAVARPAVVCVCVCVAAGPSPRCVGMMWCASRLLSRRSNLLTLPLGSQAGVTRNTNADASDLEPGRTMAGRMQSCPPRVAQHGVGERAPALEVRGRLSRPLGESVPVTPLACPMQPMLREASMQLDLHQRLHRHDGRLRSQLDDLSRRLDGYVRQEERSWQLGAIRTLSGGAPCPRHLPGLCS